MGRLPDGRTHHLVFRTAAGELFEGWSRDDDFDVPPGEPVLLEVSAVARHWGWRPGWGRAHCPCSCCSNPRARVTHAD